MILIIDFGSQYNQLIARRVREHRVYCRIEPPRISLAEIKALAPEGIILSGGPASIYEENSPRVDIEIFDLGIPILGICYGMQYMADALGGEVKRAEKREYGLAELRIKDATGIFYGIEENTNCWMSHGDTVVSLPDGFKQLAHTENTKFAAIGDQDKKLFGVQFHPEVAHTPKGLEIIKNFVYIICNCKPTWTTANFVEEQVRKIREKVGGKKVLCALSGGVDSTVVSALVHKAIGDQLTCIYVNNGLMRTGETESILQFFREKTHLKVIDVDASGYFLKELEAIVDPEEKRKRIGYGFINIFEQEAAKLGNVKYLAQGTLYPDVIESVSFRGAAVIKSHHNVGGLPEVMKLDLIEPLRDLFKDEVRELGLELGLPEEAIYRQPFPGPGLGIRIMGEITAERLDVLRKADVIVLEEMKTSGYYRKVWQSFAVLLPIQTVGVMGDERTYENVIALRCVDSVDAMTADWSKLPYDLLGRISNRIINEVRGVNRVVFDISSKPPSTIEWE